MSTLKVKKVPCNQCGKSLSGSKSVYADPNDGELDPENPKLYCSECAESGQIGAPKQ